jgi:hypothetical protein
VIGIGRAFKIDFEDVFVRAEVRYQTTQRALKQCVSSLAGGISSMGEFLKALINIQ